jgi:hypothetical protein
MLGLLFATDGEADEQGEACSWENIIRGIERFAASHPAAAPDLHDWADLLEGIRQLREGR